MSCIECGGRVYVNVSRLLVCCIIRAKWACYGPLSLLQNFATSKWYNVSAFDTTDSDIFKTSFDTNCCNPFPGVSNSDVKYSLSCSEISAFLTWLITAACVFDVAHTLDEPVYESLSPKLN